MTLPDLLLCAGVAAALTAASFVLRMRDAIGPDEGYLWYGTLRVLEGEIPLRDFRSYEPARYYWCALAMHLFGKGILGLRAGVHLFYFAGLSAGLIALRLGGLDWVAVIAAAVVLTVWAFPQYKLFEPGLLMFAVLGGVLMVLYPGPATFLPAGLVVGIAAFFGVNYGLYIGAGLFALGLLTVLRASGIEPLNTIGAFAGGAAFGMMPLLLMLAAIPGLAAAFHERRVRAILGRGTTNLPLPIPWPWRPVPRTFSGLAPAGRRFVQLYFLLLPLFAWGVAVWACLAPWSYLQATPVPFAAAFAGAFSLHHATSRADSVHLAQSITPLIAGLFGILAESVPGWIALAVIFGWGTAATVLRVHPRVIRERRPDAHTTIEIGGTMLWAPKSFSLLLNKIRKLVAEQLEPDKSLLALPTLITLYPALGVRAPVYDTYCVYPASAREEERMLRSIEASRVRLAVIDDTALDGREELRFSRTHPRVWAYLQAEFEPVEIAGLGSEYHVLRHPGGARSSD